MENIDPTTLIILAVAIVIFLRLRNVLGRRTGHERPPYDPSTVRSEEQQRYEQDNVVQLPTGREAERKAPDPTDPEVIREKVREFATDGSELANNLTELIKKDPSFDPKTFVSGAKMAYEMIVMAFNDSDLATLKPLLSSEVYESFKGEIASREDREESVDSSFIGIDSAVIVDAENRGSEAFVKIKFVSEMITAIRNKAGEVIGGDPKKIIEVTDLWTFARTVTSKDPNWKLVGTEAAH